LFDVFIDRNKIDGKNSCENIVDMKPKGFI